jgi:hypothetical protein
MRWICWRLQERWQEQAKALPLERKGAGAVAAFPRGLRRHLHQAQGSAHAADHERKAHLHAREALCTAGNGHVQWRRQGPAGRDSSTLRGQRMACGYGAACCRSPHQPALSGCAGASAGAGRCDPAPQRRSAGHALRDKLRLCQRWKALAPASAATVRPLPRNGRRAGRHPKLGGEYEKRCCGRYNAALALLGSDAASYLAQLEANRQRLLDEVLRLEIVAGVDSGAEFARERLKMQVEVLQSSLKSGQKPQSATPPICSYAPCRRWPMTVR